VDTPAAEIEIDEALVRSLLAEQHPDLAGLTLRFVASGWDNAIYRLGDELAVRLPRRAVAAELVKKEQRWMPDLASALTIPIPTPVRVGTPATAFPWPWTITSWLDGAVAEFDPSAQLVPDLVQFVRELHVAAPAGAPGNPVRGVPLADRNDAMVARLRDDPIPRRDELLDAWLAAVAAPTWSGPPLWVHGDLHPANILTTGGRLSAVIDFGDLTAGDPATDLAIAWLLFDGRGRDRFRAALDYDDATWRRAAGWALAFGTLALGGDSTFQRFGENALREVLVA
jgi:aminoglycoside phosphotransferase (APT) family kinase protein